MQGRLDRVGSSLSVGPSCAQRQVSRGRPRQPDRAEPRGLRGAMSGTQRAERNERNATSGTQRALSRTQRGCSAAARKGALCWTERQWGHDSETECFHPTLSLRLGGGGRVREQVEHTQCVEYTGHPVPTHKLPPWEPAAGERQAHHPQATGQSSALPRALPRALP